MAARQSLRSASFAERIAAVIALREILEDILSFERKRAWYENTPEGLIKFLAPSLRLPIVDWGMRREQMNASEAELRRAILGYRDTVLQAIAETEIAIANFNATNSRLIQTEKEVLTLNESAKHQQTALRAGYLSSLEAFRAFAKMQERKMVHADNQSLWLSAFAVANKAQTNMTIEKVKSAEKIRQI